MARTQDVDPNRLKLMCTTTDAVQRNRLALELAPSGRREVLEVLLELIARPELENAKGTLVHCLQYFPLEPLFELLIELIIKGSWEVAHEAAALLEDIDHMEGERVQRAYHALLEAAEAQAPGCWRHDLLEELLGGFD